MNQIDLRRFDLNLLVTFETLMVTRSVTQAAQRLYVGQPAVSHALGRLREAFHDPLFVRGAMGLEPTPRAIALEELVREVLSLTRQALEPPNDFVPAQWQQAISMGSSDYGTVLWPFLLAELQHCAPGVRLRLHAHQDDGDLQALDRGDWLLCLGHESRLPPRFCVRSLGHDVWVAISRPHHPQIPEILDFETFCRLPHLQIGNEAEIGEVLQHLGGRRRVAAAIPNFLSAPPIVAHSDFVATVPSRVAAPFSRAGFVEVHALPLVLAPLEVSVTWHRREDRTPLVHWLCDRLAQVTQRLVGWNVNEGDWETDAL